MVAFFVLNTLVVDRDGRCSTSRSPSATRPTSGRSIFPAAALRRAGRGVAVASDAARRSGRSCCSSATIGLLLISGGIGLYPNLIVSTIDPAYSLTIYNAASADNTLVVALIIALIGIPFVLLYTAGVYYIFRGKTVVDTHGY